MGEHDRRGCGLGVSRPLFLTNYANNKQHHQTHGRSLQVALTSPRRLRRRNVTALWFANTIDGPAGATTGDANCILVSYPSHLYKLSSSISSRSDHGASDAPTTTVLGGGWTSGVIAAFPGRHMERTQSCLTGGSSQHHTSF